MIKNKLFYFLITNFLLVVIGMVVCHLITFDKVYLFWLLPICYIIIQTIFFNDYKKILKSLGAITFEIVAYIRYVVIVFIYFFNNNTSYIYNNVLLIIYLMIFELFVSKLIIHHILKNRDYNIVRFNFNNIFVYLSIIIFILIAIMFPFLFKSWTMLFSNQTYEVNSIYVLLFHFTSVVLNLYIIDRVSNIKFINTSTKIIISILSSLFLCFISSISTSGNISRWYLIIMLISSLVIITKLYPIKKKKIIFIGMVFIIISLISSSFLKYNQHSFYTNNNNYTLLDSISKNFSFKTLDSYFSGMYHIEKVFDLEEKYNNNINYITLIDDIFMNFPIVNKIFDSENNIITYYNYTFYGNSISKDQICPMIGMGYIYFGIIFSPILSMISVIFMCLLSNKIEGETDSFKYFFLTMSSIYVGIFMCTNFNILFQFIWIRFIPLLIIYKLCDAKLLKLRRIKI